MENKTKTVVSIILPNLNQAKYIKEALDSVLNQKGNFKLEVIAVDGGSTDGSVDILKEYGREIKWISEKDRGQSDAINKGLKMAKGNILAYFNSDDLYEDGAIQTVVDFFLRNPRVKWIYGKCRIIDENGKEIRQFIKWYKHFLGRRYSYKKLLAENFIAQPTVFFKKEVFESAGFFDINQHLVMDYDYWLRIGKKYPVSFIEKYLARFRFHPLSKSNMNLRRQFKEDLEVAKRYAHGNYKFSIFLHYINYIKIIFCYGIMRFLGI